MQHKDPDTLIRDLDHPDAFVRANAIFLIGEQRVARAVPTLIRILTTATELAPPLADHAAWALGKIGDPQAALPLLAAYEQGSFAALDGLAGIPDDRAFSTVLRAFEQTHHPHLATLLGRRGDRRAVPALIAAMDDPDALVRFYTVRALGRLGDPQAIEALLRASDDQRVVKKTIARAVQIALAQIREQLPPDSEAQER
jgi:HEAT repeat protein